MVPLYRGPALKPDQLYFMPCAFDRLRSSSLPLFQGWSVSLLVQTPPKRGCNPHRNPVQCCFLGGQWRTRERLRTRVRRVVEDYTTALPAGAMQVTSLDLGVGHVLFSPNFED